MKAIITKMPPVLYSYPDVKRIISDEKKAVSHWKCESADANNNLMTTMRLLSEEEGNIFMLYYDDEMNVYSTKYEAQVHHRHRPIFWGLKRHRVLSRLACLGIMAYEYLRKWIEREYSIGSRFQVQQ
jgi:hypothetical protein